MATVQSLCITPSITPVFVQGVVLLSDSWIIDGDTTLVLFVLHASHFEEMEANDGVHKVQKSSGMLLLFNQSSASPPQRGFCLPTDVDLNVIR